MKLVIKAYNKQKLVSLKSGCSLHELLSIG